MTDTINALIVSQTWQIAVVALAAGVIVATCGFRRPHLAHLVWVLVLIKALTPPVFDSRLSLFSWLQTESAVTIAEPLIAPPAVPPTEVVGPPVTPDRPTVVRPAPPVSPIAPTSKPIRWQSVMLTIWGTGTLVFLAAIGLATSLSWRRLAASRIDVHPEFAARFAGLAEQLGLRSTPRLLVTTQPVGPAAGGIIVNTVILPADILDVSSAEQEPILAHELIHLRRRDPLIALLQGVAVAVWWWHPAVWWASRHVSRERERCCDAEVLGSLSYPPPQYAQRLIDTLRRPNSVAVRPAPLTIPLTRPTKQRLEYIMHHGPFTARPPRRNAFVVLALALLLLPGAGRTIQGQPQADAADADDAADATDAEIKTPQLLYLAWQVGEEATTVPLTHQLWRPSGERVDPTEAAAVLKEVGHFQSHWHQDGELHPLVLVFRVDQRVKNTTVQPILLLSDGTAVTPPGSWRNSKGKSLTVSSMAPNLRDLSEWPETISLRIRYPIEDAQVVKTITELPKVPPNHPEGRVEVAEGVTWFLDPAKAIERNPVTNRREQVPYTTAGVLESRRSPGRLDDYDVRIYLKDRRRPNDWVNSHYNTVREVGDVMYDVDVSEPFASEDVERVEFTRVRHRYSQIDNVSLKRDPLPAKAEAAPGPDSKAASEAQDATDLKNFDRDYGLRRGEVIRRIAPPFPASRMAYYRIKQAGQAEAIPRGPTTMILSWKDDESGATMIFGDPDGIELRQLLPKLCKIGPELLRGDDGLLDLRLPGDFSIDQTASREEIVPQLNRILRQWQPHPVSVRMQETDADVYVARGTFELSATAQQRKVVIIENAIVGWSNSVDEAIKYADSSPRTDLNGFLNWVANCADVPIVNEVESPPKERFPYVSIAGSIKRGDPKFDPQTVLNGVSEQTGLTFTKEKRPLKTLLVEDVR